MNQHLPFRVALTGGIACGKTTATDMFAALGVPVIDADVISHELTAAGQPGLEALTARFGDSILLPDGQLDRPALRKKLFSDDTVRKQVNDLLHPLILSEMQYRLAQCNTAEYVILAIPLAVETGSTRMADRILVVDCDPQQQIARLQLRDQDDGDQAQKILQVQTGRENRLAHADDVIDNNGDLDSLQQQVAKLHSHYQSLAKQAEFKHNKR